MKKATERIRTADRVFTNQLPTDAHVRLQVCELLGRRVATLLDGKQQAGDRTVFWDASGVSSGLYFYKLTARKGRGNRVFRDVKKMLLVKRYILICDNEDPASAGFFV